MPTSEPKREIRDAAKQADDMFKLLELVENHQMPRGAKRDKTVTQNLQEAGILEDNRSFISLDGHLFLEGQDKAKVRPLVFARYHNKCVVCHTFLHPDAAAWMPWCGAWHHVKNCDCVGCSELRCDTTTGRKCHAHRTEGFEREHVTKYVTVDEPDKGFDEPTRD